MLTWVLRRSVFVAMGCATAAISLTPAANAQGLLNRLEKRLEGVLNAARSPADPAATPVAEQGYLGMTGDDQGEAGRGVRVVAVRPGGPADIAGLREGDLVTAVNDAPIAKLDDMQNGLAGKPVGSRMDFRIQRGDTNQTLAVTLSRRPVDPAAEGGERDPAFAETSDLPPPRDRVRNPGGPRVPLMRPADASNASDAIPDDSERSVLRRDDMPLEDPLSRTAEVPSDVSARPSLGISVLPVTEEARREYHLTVRQGALIGAIAPGSIADRAKLSVGNVIVAAEGRRIEQPDDLIEVLRNARAGDTLMLSFYRGNTLYRKTVKLSEAPSNVVVGRVNPVAAEDDRLPAPRGEVVRDGDRPLLRRLERALDGAAPAVERSVPVPVDTMEGDLRAEVQKLRARIDQLEQRLARLESPATEGDDRTSPPVVEPDNASDDAPPSRTPPPRPAPPAGNVPKPNNPPPPEAAEPDPAAEPTLELSPPSDTPAANDQPSSPVKPPPPPRPKPL